MIKTMMRPMMLIVAIGLASPRLAGAQTRGRRADVPRHEPIGADGQRRPRSRCRAGDERQDLALRANLATLPVRTSSGAFVYRLNPELGTVERATQSYGPFFVERALTAGLHQASFGLTFQHLRFTSLDGASLRDGSTSGHANAGISLGGLAREVSYGGALALAATGRVTVTGELLGRWLDSSGHITRFVAPHPRLTGVQTIRLTPDASTLHIITLVPGVKWNVSDTWVLAADVSVPLTSGGLTSRFTPFVGLDYARSR
jgi:hypothetical protein